MNLKKRSEMIKIFDKIEALKINRPFGTAPKPPKMTLENRMKKIYSLEAKAKRIYEGEKNG